MNEIDVAILVVVGLSALLGVIRGMLTEVLSLLVWIAALWLTVAYGDAMAARFTGIETPLLRSLAGHGATFALVVVLGNLAVWLLRTLVHGAGLSGTDRLLGLGFGAARGYAIVLAVVLLVSFTPWARAALWRDSTLMPAFTAPAGWIVAQLPDTSVLSAFVGPASPGADAAADDAGALPPIAGLDLAHAAQWLGVVPQQGHPLLREWAVQAGLIDTAPDAANAPALGDPARVAPAGVDPARADPATADAARVAPSVTPDPESP